MILRPTRRIVESVYDIPEFKQVKRTIILYTDGNEIKKDYDICIINHSAQSGNCGGYINNSEVLHSSNFYYGTISDPFVLKSNDSYKLNTKNVRLNLDALVFINDYNYLHKLSNHVMEREKTISTYDEMFYGDELRFTGVNKIVVPPDPRYFNLDHQILITNDDSSLVTPDKISGLYQNFLSDAHGMYSLREFIDSETLILMNEIIYDDPQDLLQLPVYGSEDSKDTIATVMNRNILNLISGAARSFLTSFTAIFDAAHGYNLHEASRYLKFDKYQITDDNIGFASTMDHVWDSMCDLNLQMRITVRYTNAKTYVQLLPCDINNPFKKEVKEKDIAIKDLIIDYYNTY